MKHSVSADRLLLFSYFIVIIIVGTILLSLPAAWNGAGRLPFIDAFFTATSAVCVTGLITVDTAMYSSFGKGVILFLIQTGGLGIISFTTLYLAVPRKRISFRSIGFVKGYYLDTVEHKAEHIIRNIVLTTIALELIGSCIIFVGLRKQGDFSYPNALFHSVSAFCNAGFSLFSDGLEGFTANRWVSGGIMTLIVLGGLGFVVLQDLVLRLTGKRTRLHTHTKIVLTASCILIVGGAFGYFVFERNGTLEGYSGGTQIMAAFFQSITTRTAGFNTISQTDMSLSSKILTLPLMFTGGASGSIAGGVKVTTMFLVILSVFSSGEENAEVRFGKRKISRNDLSNASMFVIKAMLLLFTSIFALSMVEAGRGDGFLPIVFESFSAFGTVGLSLGLTPELTAAGKFIIMLTMFAGRVGLVSLAMNQPRKAIERQIQYPEGEVLIG
ncbi:MAG: potassium transporter [Spirochaetales bacterium]|nr:potassium transporter [Spirochaetales bacterium]